MWSHSRKPGQVAAAIAALCAAAWLSACSFTPLYGDAAPLGNGHLAFRYAEPANRLDRIIYQDLALSFTRSRAVDAPELVITTSSATRRIGRTSSGSPATAREATVTATAIVTAAGAGAPLYTVSRSASATYTTNAQRLASAYAREEAEERAARAVAQSLKLLIAAELPGRL